MIASIGEPPYLGGIENVIATILASKLSSIYTFNIFDTYRTPDPKRTLIEKILFATTLPIRCALSIKKTQPDLVHIHFCSKIDFWKHAICLFTAKAMRKKIIFHLHGGSFDKFYNQYHPFMKCIIRFILRRADMMVALSEYWKNFLTSFMDGNKIRIVPNPINCSAYIALRGTKQKDRPKNIILIGSIGRRKGHYDVLKALPLVLKRHPDAIVQFAGLDEDFDATENLKRLVIENKIADNVHFLGAVFGESKKQLIKESYLFILPSYGENLPISVLEGMAAGKPVIATRVGALPEIIHHKINGILIDPGDWKSLASNIIELLDNPGAADEMGAKAYETMVNNFDINRIKVKYDDIYMEL